MLLGHSYRRTLGGCVSLISSHPCSALTRSHHTATLAISACFKNTGSFHTRSSTMRTTSGSSLWTHDAAPSRSWCPIANAMLRACSAVHNIARTSAYRALTSSLCVSLGSCGIGLPGTGGVPNIETTRRRAWNLGTATMRGVCWWASLAPTSAPASSRIDTTPAQPCEGG